VFINSQFICQKAGAKSGGACHAASAPSSTLLLGQEDSLERTVLPAKKDKTIGVISKEPEQEMRRRRGAEDSAVARLLSLS